MTGYHKLDNGSYVHPDDPGEPQNGHRRLSITDQEASILQGFADGRVVLEIGTGLGVSTRALAEVAEQVITVDIDRWVHENIVPTLPENVLATTEIDPQVYNDLMPEMVFIDGDHSFEATRRDIGMAQDIVVPGGLVVIHDAHAPQVWKACSAAGFRIRIDTVHGIGVWNNAPH